MAGWGFVPARLAHMELPHGQPLRLPGFFDTAEAAFRLLCAGPQPLALHAAKVTAGLPDRPVPLNELRVLLLHPSTSSRTRNQVWAELVRRAPAGDPAWVIGLTGIAMPGPAPHRRAAWPPPTTLTSPDLQAEVLSGFLEAVRALDPGRPGISAAGIPAVLGGLAGRAAAHPSTEAAKTRNRRGPRPSCVTIVPARPGGTRTWCSPPPSAEGILTAAQAALITRNRLEGVPLSQIAAETGISHSALCNRRKKAEKAITGAIANGFSAD